MNNSLYDLEIRISKLLRHGVILAGILMFVGWMMQIHFGGNPFDAFKNYETVRFSTTVVEMYREGQWGFLISGVGLLVLISLPTLRVFMTAVLFIRQKEYVLAAVAGFVLLVLIASFSLGLEI